MLNIDVTCLIHVKYEINGYTLFVRLYDRQRRNATNKSLFGKIKLKDFRCIPCKLKLRKMFMHFFRFPGFDYLLRQLPDLILDTPDAPVILGNFVARAIADDCIPPKFLKSYKGNVETEEAKDALRLGFSKILASC